MLIARVIGEMVSTEKHPSHVGRKALVVQPLDLDGTNRGDPVIAFDAVQRPESPIDMAVIGVIDWIDLDALAQTPAAHRK